MHKHWLNCNPLGKRSKQIHGNKRCNTYFQGNDANFLVKLTFSRVYLVKRMKKREDEDTVAADEFKFDESVL